MATSYTYDDLLLALAREAFKGKYPIDLDSTSGGAAGGTTAIFGDLAFGSSGATTNAFDDVWLYWRKTRGTASAGAATTITLESGHTYATNALANMTIRITSGTGSGQSRVITSNTNANPSVLTVPTWTTNPSTDSVYEIIPYSASEGQVIRMSKVIRGGLTVADGTLTVAPAFGIVGTAAMVQTRSDMLFGYDVNILMLREYLNRVLRMTDFWSYLCPSLVTDGDMEDADMTNWAAVGSPTTREKTTTSYPFPFGRQAAHVVTGTTAHGITSNNVPVNESETLELAVMVKVASGDCQIVLRDATNGSNLKAVTVTDQQPVIVWFQQGVSSTTVNVTVRALSVTASSEFYVGQVCLLSQDRNRCPLDTTSIKNADDVEGVYHLPLLQPAETDAYLISDSLARYAGSVERDDRGNLINVVTRPRAPLLLKVRQRWPELASDIDTTLADRDAVIQGAMYHVEMERAARAVDPIDKRLHIAKARQHGRNFWNVMDGLGIRPQAHEEAAERVLARRV